MPTPFDGDFSLLPFTAHVRYGEVPRWPTDDDFHLAASDVAHNPDDAAAHWRIEAVRERRHRPGVELDAPTLKAIALRTADRLYQRVMATL
jgi:hypothetical protein